jgi:multiple sugar transport system substrate-binding protein
MRWTRRLTLLVVFALVVAACGDDDVVDTTTTTTTTTTPDAPPTTLAPGALEGVDITVWGWASSEAEDTALMGLLSQFNDETGARAVFQPQDPYDTALATALAGGLPPDVFYVDSFRLADLADAGQLGPVPSGTLSNPNDIFESLRAAFTFEGTWFCPPKDFSTLALVYDPIALEAAGVDVPTTWEELAAAAETLTVDGQAGLAMGVEYPRWAVFLFQAGVALTDDDVTEITLDNDAARGALQYIADRYAAGHFVRPSDVDAGWAGEAYGQGKAAMTIEGNWIVGYLEDVFPDRDFAVAELPAGPVGMGTFAFTVCYGVPTNADNPDASWALVEYLTSAAGASAWTRAFRVMPARASVIDQWIAENPELEAFARGAGYARRWGFRPGFGDVIGVFNDMANGLVDGDVTVDELIADVVFAGEDVLRRS